MKMSYNLTEKTTRTEKFEKYLNMYIINFKTNCYKLTASGNVIHSILNYKLLRPAGNLRLPKNKNRQNSKLKKKFSGKSVEDIKNRTFYNYFSIFN